MPKLTWIGKKSVIKHHEEVALRLLRPVPERARGGEAVHEEALREPAARIAGGTPALLFRGPRLKFPQEFMKNSRKEERLESLPWQTEESLSERGKGKSMQPVTEDSASQGDDGDSLAPGPAGALEQEGQLFLLGAFANQARRPTVPPIPPPDPVIPAQAGIQHSATISGFKASAGMTGIFTASS
ncbi:MAG: hypothetical protein LBQ62_03155 [Candidatus Accumulibacter sp.]|jgi:hypothetical protein|nr:hypothetical protein [Accumulibacter sp.]